MTPGGAPPRVGFDDRAYFEAATEAADPGRFDLVIVDEWQTVSDLERAFVERLAARSSLVAVKDPTRDLRNASRQTDAGLDVLSLTEGFRAKDGVARLDAIYATEGFDPFPSPLAAATVLVSVLDDPDALEKRVQEAVVALWRRGFAQGEVGVASGLGRDRSALATNLKAPPTGPRTFQLTDAPARTGLACDGFSYWLGLERRAMVLAEFPTSLADRRKRLHIALSRACEEVHLLLPREDIKEDQALSAWHKATRAIR